MHRPEVWRPILRGPLRRMNRRWRNQLNAARLEPTVVSAARVDLRSAIAIRRSQQLARGPRTGQTHRCRRESSVRPLCYQRIMAGRIQRKRHIQLNLESARRPERKHGGWRPGAGRKRGGNTVPHSTRPDAPARFPQLVTFRLIKGAPFIATDLLIRHIHGVVAKSQRGWFRIIEFNVLGNHIHLIVEVADKYALARGAQGFAVRFARLINTVSCRRGRLFDHRYHARALKTPRQVRYAVRYVLLKRKHHSAEKRFQRRPAAMHSHPSPFASE